MSGIKFKTYLSRVWFLCQLSRVIKSVPTCQDTNGSISNTRSHSRHSLRRQPFFHGRSKCGLDSRNFFSISGCSNTQDASLRLLPSTQFCITADFPPLGELISLRLRGIQADSTWPLAVSLAMFGHFFTAWFHLWSSRCEYFSPAVVLSCHPSMSFAILCTVTVVKEFKCFGLQFQRGF